MEELDDNLQVVVKLLWFKRIKVDGQFGLEKIIKL